MAKTSVEIAAEALREIGVVSQYETPGPEQIVRAQSHLTAMLEELDAIHGLAIQWTIETVPETHFRGISKALAGSLANGYSKSEFSGLYEEGVGIIRDIEFAASDNSTVPATYY